MSSIRIGRLDSRYRVAAGTEPPAAVQTRLDRVARDHLAPALDAVARQLPEVAGEEVWVVRELDVALSVDLDGSAPGAVAGQWSRGLVAALRAALAGAPGAAAVRFASPAAWTAAFVAELAAGTAWGRWYFGAFTSLRPLPVGRAIAEAFAREPGQAAGVLRELAASGDLELVLLHLGAGDARRIAAVVAPPGEPEAVSGRALALALAQLGGALRPAGAPHVAGSALRLLAAALHAGVPLPPGAPAVAAAVVLLADLLAGDVDAGAVGRALRRGGWVSALRAAGRPPDAVSAEGLAAGETLRALANGDEGWLVRLTGGLAAVPAAAVASLATPFGGLVLLWPVFAEMWARVEHGDASDAALWRVLVASRLFGERRRDALARDPVLALLCGLDRPPVPDRLEAARATLPAAALAAAAGAGGAVLPAPDAPDAVFFGVAPGPAEAAADAFAAAVLHRFAERLPGFTTSSPGHLVRNFLDVPATLRRGDGDAWEASITGPPLQVVLRMAGMSRLHVEPPWLRGRPVTADLRWG